jgi:hypothetical protein
MDIGFAPEVFFGQKHYRIKVLLIQEVNARVSKITLTSANMQII